ncbi:MAG: TRAP transporter TatT component family protein [Woeseiaceae bacterium]|nr:TRAP transporter TatT component family protein [Woeseiaceae bacterium]
MTTRTRTTLSKTLPLLLLVSLTGGCIQTIVSNAATGFSENLSQAVLNQPDPETAKAAIPSYMILLDGMLEGSEDDADLLAAAATMYASYGAVFADDEIRSARLTKRARGYALEAMCISYKAACGWPDMTYDEFVASLAGVTAKQADHLYTYGFASLAFLRAHSSDWNSLAELPQMEALFKHYIAIAGGSVEPATHTYMGILLTLRPPALGGKPEEARAHFEKAIELSNGRDLGAKVEFARGYAKMLYERELHDRLLNEVIAADPEEDGLTLLNVLAQEDAAQLLAEADDYF